jgi:hypothetical protein
MTITGKATPQGTRNYAARYPRLTFNPLNDTGLVVSQAGFGGCRSGHSGFLENWGALSNSTVIGSPIKWDFMRLSVPVCELASYKSGSW